MSTDHGQHGRSLPVEWEAENAIHAAEHHEFTQRSRSQIMQMFLRSGYTPEQARAELAKHDQRVGALADAMQSATTNTAPAVVQPEPSTPTPDAPERADPEPDPAPSATQPPRWTERDTDRDREPELRMPAMPGAFSRALSSPGHWIKAFALAALAGGAVFLLLNGVLHWLFGTGSFLTWPTGIAAGVVALPTFLGVLSAASREVREWVRVGGPKPIQWR